MITIIRSFPFSTVLYLPLVEVGRPAFLPRNNPRGVPGTRHWL